jgi:hypothetical protein
VPLLACIHYRHLQTKGMNTCEIEMRIPSVFPGQQNKIVEAQPISVDASVVGCLLTRREHFSTFPPLPSPPNYHLPHRTIAKLLMYHKRSFHYTAEFIKKPRSSLLKRRSCLCKFFTVNKHLREENCLLSCLVSNRCRSSNKQSRP